MTSKIFANGIFRAVVYIALLLVALYFLYLVQTVLIYLMVALVMTLIGNPIKAFLLKRLRFSNNLATIGTILVFTTIIVGFLMLFIPLLIAQGDNLSLLNTKAIEKNVLELYGQLNHFFNKHHFNFQAFIKESNLSSKVDFALLPNFLNSIIGFISDFGMALGAVLFITFFFLKDKKLFTQAAKTLLPDQHEDKILNSLDKINNLLSRYFIGIIIQLSFVFVLYLIVLLIFGIQNALVIAFLCAVLNIVPYIGPLIASILAAILTMINYLGADFQKETLPTTIYVLLGFWVVQIIDNNICQPIIFSNSVKSHPLEIFIVILLAGFSIGIVGMIVAIPCYTMLKVVGKEFLPDNKIIQLLTKNI